MGKFEKEIKRFEQGETWEDTDEVVEVEIKKPLNIVVPVRPSSDKWKQLRAEAKELGIGPSTLVRMWVLERLRQLDKAQVKG